MSKYRPGLDTKQREERRMEALRWLRAGEHAAVVAADLGVGANSVYTWGKLARVGGKKALKAKAGRGRPLKLGREHWALLKRMVLKGPKACGFARELCTLPMIKGLIEREFNVSYHDDHLSKFVRRLGLSVRKPMVTSPGA